MDVIQIFNGLGNQMSQYAFYYAKKKRSPYRTCFMISRELSQIQHNGYELDRIFGIKSNKIKEKILFYFNKAGHFPVFGYKVFGRFSHYIQEYKNYDFDAKMLCPSPNWGFSFYFGGWHCEKYFIDFREDLLKVFKFDESRLNQKSVLWRDIIENDKNSCSLHVRRGDFLENNKWSEAISEDYYDKAIYYMRGQKPEINFYVFSNDIQWCKTKFGAEGFFYIDCNTKEDSWQDMYLISKCRHHINANSTFSWWGAWLCTYPDSKTIVPKSFISTMETKDIYPETWIKM